jgi:excisionase family DNA binding protein
MEKDATSSPWMTPKEAAAYISVHPGTMHNWRSQGKGPTYKVVGTRIVRYHRQDLDAFLSAGAA